MTCLYQAKYGLSYSVYATSSSCGFLDCDTGGTGGHLYKHLFYNRVEFIMPQKYMAKSRVEVTPEVELLSTA